MLTILSQLNRIAGPNLAALNHIAVQCKLAIELADNFPEHPTILPLRIGIERGHDAAPAQVLDSNNDLPDAQALSRPRSLRQPIDIADHKVWPEPPAVMAESLDRAVGRYQERQDVEPVGRFIVDQAGAWSDDVNDLLQHLRLGPRQSVHSGFARSVEGRVMSKQPRMSSGCDEAPAGILYVNDAIPGNPKRTQHCMVQSLASHRFDGISPDLCDFHG
jgi:hypothetical protein